MLVMTSKDVQRATCEIYYPQGLDEPRQTRTLKLLVKFLEIVIIVVIIVVVIIILVTLS